MKQFNIGDKVYYKYYYSDKVYTGTIYEFRNILLIKSDIESHSPAVGMRTLEFCKLAIDI